MELVTNAELKEGLFRKSGRAAAIRQAIQRFTETGAFQPAVDSDAGRLGANELTGLIKQFFRDQPTGCLFSIKTVLLDIAAKATSMSHVTKILA